MAVMKRKDLDWKYYLRELALSTTKITDLDRLEFAGFLLRRDMQDSQKRKEIIGQLLTQDESYFGDVLASYIIVETPDAVEALTNNLKKLLLQHYGEEIDILIQKEKNFLQDDGA